MKHLCGRLESQSFTGSVIQPVFDHANFLVDDICHRPVLGHILPQQSVALDAASNYWGPTTSSVIDSMIFDRNDNLNSGGVVNYTPVPSVPNSATPM